MARLGINTGANPNDGQGDPLRVAMGKINSNFTEIYNVIGDGNILTGYANIAGISTLARNLTDSPLISVSGILNSGITTTEHIEVRNIKSTGVVTATQFVGDGSGLTGVVAAGSGGFVLQEEGTNVGTARTINFVGASVTAGISSGIAVVQISNNYSNIAGVATYATTAGIVTYASNAGVATYSSNTGVTTNLKGGSAGSIPYQTATNSTSFISIGSVGYILQSNGPGLPPSWVIAAPSNAISGLTIREEGTIVGTANSVSQLNFVGPNIIASVSGNISTITVADYVSNAGVSTYASTAGVATYASTAGVSTYAATAGIVTYASTAGVATYATIAGIVTYATIAGVATYSDTAGVSTYAATAGIVTYASTAGVASGLTGIPDINVGVITATSFSGNGSNLAGIVTYIEAGNEISINQNTGKVIITNIGAGVTVTNILYVTTDGNDTNTGRKIGNAKRTIGAALTAATTGTVIKVSAGSYIENNPLTIPAQVSIIGDSLREVSVSPQNANQDLFYVSNGNYVAEMSFTGSLNQGQAVFAFDPNKVGYFNQSPYVQNCTNFIPNSTGMKIDGSKAIGPLKSMVVDSYTQYNQGGIGVLITNEGYAQLVSLFTICDDIAVYCGSGGACDLTNSNSSFGNYGLIAEGVGPKKYTGVVTYAATENSNTFAIDLNVPTLSVSTATYDNITGIVTITTSTNHNLNVGMGVSIVGLAFTCSSGPGIVTYPSGNNGYIFEVASVNAANTFSAYVGPSTLPHTYQSGGTVTINAVRPFDGQVVYFDELYYSVGKVAVSSGGTGYFSTPTVTISPPSTPWGIQATAVAEVVNGSVSSIEIVSSGRGYETTPTITISSPDVGINTATSIITLLPSYYVIESSTPISSGISTITLTEDVPYAVGVGSTVPFFKQSRVLASGHSFEYIGSGVTIANALPAAGGVPIQENETDSRNGGLVVYTSTDQSGNFRIGDGVTINQQTGTISGSFYSKSLFSTMTPFILALGGE